MLTVRCRESPVCLEIHAPHFFGSSLSDKINSTCVPLLGIGFSPEEKTGTFRLRPASGLCFQLGVNYLHAHIHWRFRYAHHKTKDILWSRVSEQEEECRRRGWGTIYMPISTKDSGMPTTRPKTGSLSRVSRQEESVEGGGGGDYLHTRIHWKFLACPPWDQRLATQSGVSGQVYSVTLTTVKCTLTDYSTMHQQLYDCVTLTETTGHT